MRKSCLPNVDVGQTVSTRCGVCRLRKGVVIHMQKVVIGKNQAGQRFDKFLHKYLPQAGNAFLYKMLRKKNITLNGRKAEGREILAEGDVVDTFFSEETFAKFSGQTAAQDAVSGTVCASEQGFGGGQGQLCARTNVAQGCTPKAEMQGGTPRTAAAQGGIPGAAPSEFAAAYRKFAGIGILFENEHIVIVDKPAGILSQKAERMDLSLNEWLIGYLLANGSLSEEELRTFHPSVCNRLDRNTSGIVLCGKSLAGLQELSSLLKEGSILQERSLRKFYRTICAGEIKQEMVLEGMLKKDSKTNKVTIEHISRERAAGKWASGENTAAKALSVQLAAGEAADFRTDGVYVRTAVRPIACGGGYTYLEAELFTGKSHQIRAQLAAIGHPIIGDVKYGDEERNRYFMRKYRLKTHLLHACCVQFPPEDSGNAAADGSEVKRASALQDVLGRSFSAPCPKYFEKMIEDMENSY